MNDCGAFGGLPADPNFEEVPRRVMTHERRHVVTEFLEPNVVAECMPDGSCELGK